MTNQEWIDLLGSDVDNLAHHLFTLDITDNFIRNCNNAPKRQMPKFRKIFKFSEKEISLLRLATIIHDWGEAIKGDIIADPKTKDDEIEEMTCLHKICAQILKNQNNRVSYETVAQAIDEIINNRSTKLGKVFNAIENIGYWTTAINAW